MGLFFMFVIFARRQRRGVRQEAYREDYGNIREVAVEGFPGAAGDFFELTPRPRRDGFEKIGGADRDRTDDLSVANAALSQLSYGPTRPIDGQYPCR